MTPEEVKKVVRNMKAQARRYHERGSQAVAWREDRDVLVNVSYNGKSYQWGSIYDHYRKTSEKRAVEILSGMDRVAGQLP